MARVRRKVAKLIGIIYFLQGSLGIASVAVPFYLRESGLTVRDIAFYNSIVAIPWFFKIIYGVISDSYPIFGLRRKPYLLISTAFAWLGWVLMAAFPAKLYFLAFAMMTANFGFAMIDVVTDGIVVEHSYSRNAQTYQSISWGTRSLGSVVSGVLGGYLAATLDYHIIFIITSCLPVIAWITVFLYHEEKPTKTASPSPKNALTSISRSFKCLISGDLRWFCVLLIIFSFSCSFLTPLFFYMKESLHFEQRFLGFLSSMTWAGATVGCFLYLNFLKRLPLKRALYMAMAIGVIEILFCLFIRDRFSAVLISTSAGILTYISLLPLMSAAAKLAHNTGVESSLFAILMSIFNIGQAISTFLGGWLNEVIGIQALIVLTATLTLSGFLVIRQFKTLL